MPRGGKRPGAGRKPGSLNKRSTAQAAKARASENWKGKNFADMDMLERQLACAEKLWKDERYSECALILSRVSPYTHQKLVATSEPVKASALQRFQRDLFDDVAPSAAPAASAEKPQGNSWDGLLN